jgi:hypothetical protein
LQSEEHYALPTDKNRKTHCCKRVLQKHARSFSFFFVSHNSQSSAHLTRQNELDSSILSASIRRCGPFEACHIFNRASERGTAFFISCSETGGQAFLVTHPGGEVENRCNTEKFVRELRNELNVMLPLLQLLSIQNKKNEDVACFIIRG